MGVSSVDPTEISHSLPTEAVEMIKTQFHQSHAPEVSQDSFSNYQQMPALGGA
jgi:hypothetical protein